MARESKKIESRPDKAPRTPVVVVEEFDLHPDDPEPGCYAAREYIPADEDDRW